MKKRSRKKLNYRSQGAMGRRRRGVFLATIGIVIVVILAAAYGIIQMAETRSHRAAETLVSQVADHIDTRLTEVEAVTREAAGKASGIIDSPGALTQFVRDFVKKNDLVYGSTIAFEPDWFEDRGRCFAPYSWTADDGSVRSRQLGEETDYYTEEWYAETKRAGTEFWSEPYFDEGGAKIMMCTFSVPLFDSDGTFAAVMTADVGLDELESYIYEIDPYEDSFILLRSKKGVTLASKNAESLEHSENVIIKGSTEIGWTVELSLPFSYLLYGDTGMFFFVGAVLLVTVAFVWFINRIINNITQRSSAEYLNVIDALSNSFTSIYLLNLISGETMVFRDPEGYDNVIGSLLPEESGFTEKLSRLINYDTYAGDRWMMLREVQQDTIAHNLEYQDRYEIRFRKETVKGIGWYEMNVAVMERDPAGSPLRAVVVFADVNDSVTKEKETQETLEQALLAAQSASRAKTDFLFNMSHDIRTPMNAIIGFTNMARKHIDDRERVIDCLDKTQQSGNLLLALINSVLDVSRIESGHATIEESPADVTKSFDAVRETLSELAQTSDIDISFEIKDIRDRYVFCDLDRCNRIFVNIISNAIKYTRAGGYVKVKCEQVDSDREGFGMYRYTFADNGIGMSAEFQKHVFDQFSREQTSTVSGIQGSGLGLAVCKSFTELMGGTIECDSAPNAGTTFTVTLPFRIQDGMRYIDPYTREEVNAGESVSETEPVVFAGRKVLLVEDNEMNLEIAVEILEDEGLVVETAADGSSAVEIMREKGPDYYDFVLMDIQMPVMNGYEATQAIRRMYPFSSIPVIALSANAFAEDRAASKSAGMNDHVAKPINVQELFGVLAKYLQR